ncbi:MAG: sulfite exporter TauE/SafE family protein [Paracoccaceae bacterium]|nr:sulfite exporter TauE/SafE family protein [Paracoccaceae bacterium]
MLTEVLNTVWATQGILWIALAAFVAGIVRGFTGFGTAMIFLPVAGTFLPPIAALTVLTVMDFFGPIPLLSKAVKDARQNDLVRLLIPMALILPAALWLLSYADPQIFRYLVSSLAICLLLCLIFGLQYKGKVTTPMLVSIGVFSGVTGGFLGMPGPPVILFYMAGPYRAAVVRANTLLFLFSFDALFIMIIYVFGFMEMEAVFLGLAMVVPIVTGNLVGAKFFNPEKERVYRFVAFCIIAISAIKGLPLLD